MEPQGFFELLDWLRARDLKVFVDLKFFDITETVARAVARLSERGAQFCTIHGNQSIMEAAAKAKSNGLKVLAVMAQWASVDEMARIRDRINADAQQPIRGMLAALFTGSRLEAAISMLAGVVACPTLMFGRPPDDDVIETAVDVILQAAPERP